MAGSNRARTSQGPRRPHIDPALERHAEQFYGVYGLGPELIAAIVRSGWRVTFIQPVGDPDKGGSPGSRGGFPSEWVVRARPPREIAESFDLQVEVLFFVTPFDDLQARTVQAARSVMSSDPRASRDVVFLVTGDERADAKIPQIPRSDGVVPITWGWVRSASGGGQGEKPLRGRLERFLYARDLFDVQTPVVGDRFFGRQQLLQQLKRFALQDQPVGIFGLRKIGKTSLIKTFVDETHRWSPADPVLLAVHIDLQSIPIGQRNWQYLLWDIARTTANAWQEHPALETVALNLPFFRTSATRPPTVEASLAFDADIRELVSKLAGPSGGGHLVLVFDEIERLIPPTETERAFEGAVELLRYLRGLNQQGISFSFVVAGANPYFAERSTITGQENPVLNFIYKQYVAPLAEDETRLMVSRLAGPMGVRFHHEATSLVFEHAGGHPYLTRQLCSVVIRRDRRARPMVISPADLEAGLSDFSMSQHHSFDQMFESLSAYPDEQFLLRQLATGDQEFVAEWARSDPLGLEHLKGYGLIEETQGLGYRFTIPLFREYLINTGRA